MQPKFTAKIQGGELTYQDAAFLQRWLSTFEEGQLMLVQIDKFRHRRSPAANNYIHLVFREIAKHTGHTADEIKTFYKGEYATVYDENGLPTIEKTSKMTTERMREFTDDVLNHAAEFFGVILPSEQI